MFRKPRSFYFLLSMLFSVAHSQESIGEAAEVVVTPYKTTLLADGKDTTLIRISIG